MERPLLRYAACVSVASAMWIGTALSDRAQSDNSPASDPIISILDAEPILQSQLDDSVDGRITQREQQLYALRVQALTKLIEQRLIASEAARRSVTAHAVVEQEIDHKLPRPSESDLRPFLSSNDLASGHPSDTAIAQAKTQFAHIAREARRWAFLSELTKDHRIQILLSSPRRFRIASDAMATVRGPDSAPVTIVEFGDLYCPACRGAISSLDALVAQNPAQIRIVYRHFPLDQMHPFATTAAEAAWCAQRQHRFWDFQRALAQQAADRADGYDLDSAAAQASLDLTLYKQCRASSVTRNAVQEDIREAARLNIHGTPTVFINGIRFDGVPPLDTLRATIAFELYRGGGAGLGR